jgi:tetratricopeptide (TPR) repeat protein
MGRSILASILLCLLTSTPVSSQQPFDASALAAIEQDAVALLLKEDLSKVIEQLQREQPTTVAPLLRQLILYSRASHSDGVLKTLKELKGASDWPAAIQSYYVLQKIKQSIGDDLTALRYYYDELSPQDTDGAEAFLRLWDKKGDAKELDSWLAAHSTGDDEWFRLRLYRRAIQGTATELLEPMKAPIRANPQDLNLVKRYLRANNSANNFQDVSWLGDVCEPSGAYENYELGELIGRTSPGAAIRFLEKSLSLPITTHDAELVRTGLRVQIPPAKLDEAKQLRFWTKQLLAEAYQITKRAREAQKLVEELVTMKGDDIFSWDVHQLAGAVQAQTGQRVVERKILVDEATKRQTSQYWLERAGYYRGRDDYDLERDSYLKALVTVPFDGKDQKTHWERLELVRAFAFFAKEHQERPQAKPELEALLRREFKLTPPESGYAFGVARLITNDEFELDGLRHSLFSSQPALVVQLLNARENWGNEEEALIEDVVRGDETSAAEEDAIWSALEKLVTNPGSLRANYLAEAMMFRGTFDRAIPLLTGYLRSGASHEYVSRAGVLQHLVRAYSSTGKWKEAEELLVRHSDLAWQLMAYDLGVVAASAAQNGAPADAVRLWKMKVNLDRRDLTGLDQLSRTEARSALRDFYLQMKKDDPQSTIAELALATLR